MRNAVLLTLCALIGCAELGPKDQTPPAQSPGSVIGTVRVGDPLGAESKLAGATVVFVEAAAVARTPSIQPLEDLAETAELRVTTNSEGVYVIAIEPARYFVYALPPEGSAALPGGDVSHRSFVVDSGAVLTLDLTLSSSPPLTATWAGSAACLRCHEEHRTTLSSRHFSGVRAPGVSNPLQDLSQTASVAPAFSGAPITDHDGDGQNDFAQNLTLSLPTVGALALSYIDVDLSSSLTDGDELTMTFGERIFAVWLTYGATGGLGRPASGRQRFITKLDSDLAPMLRSAGAGQGAYYVLPLAYDRAAAIGDRWTEVDTEGWFNGAGLTPPAAAQNFDVQCAGCHMTVTALGPQGATLSQDPGGVFDYDDDGAPDELGIGCERCHGPGSEHVAIGGGHVAIVNPNRLGPAARSILCGQCHQRGVGHAQVSGTRTGYPSRESGGRIELPRAGERPAVFYGTPNGENILPSFGTRSSTGYFEPVDLDNEAVSWRDLRFGASNDHVRIGRMQYLDFVRARMYRNETELLSCFTCHDPHTDEHPRQLRESSEDNLLCFGCHNGEYIFSGSIENISRAQVAELVDGTESSASVSVIEADVLRHQAIYTFSLVGASMNNADGEYAPKGELPKGRCTTCHMPKTARGARWTIDAQDNLLGGDIRSHIFDVISPDVARVMTEAGLPGVPNSCVRCHRGAPTLDIQFPDFRYQSEAGP